MRQWLPQEEDVDLSTAYRALRWAPEDRPGIALDMVVGIDGGVTIGDRSGPIGGNGDRMAFTGLRDAADVVLVGAGTVRNENYGPPVRRDEAVERRLAAGRTPVAAMAIVSRSLDLDPTMRVFGDPERLPVVIAPSCAPQDRERVLADAGIEVWRVGDQEVDFVAVRERFEGRGWREVLSEGGPSLNTAMFQQQVVDHLFVTVAPKITGSDRHLVDGGVLAAVDLELSAAIHHEGELLLRYRVRRWD